jgi:hypothetical protein
MLLLRYECFMIVFVRSFVRALTRLETLQSNATVRSRKRFKIERSTVKE